MSDADTMSQNTGIAGRTDVDEIAKAGLGDPTSLKPAEIILLCAWQIQHEAHILAHQRLLSNTATTRDITAERRAARAAELTGNGGDLVKRIEPLKPVDTDTTEHAS